MINEENQPSKTDSIGENPQQENVKHDQRSTTYGSDVTSPEKNHVELLNGKTDEEKPRRLLMPQDARYSIDLNDREKFLNKYQSYQVSVVNASHLRLVFDHQQKKILCDQNQNDQSNLQRLIKTFDVSILSGYQNSLKHVFKIYGTESNVRQALIDLIEQFFNSPQNVQNKKDSEKLVESKDDDVRETPNLINEEEKTETVPLSSTTTNENSANSVSVSVDESKIVELKPNVSKDEKVNESDNNQKEKSVTKKYSLIILITGQGQEVLKKNWSLVGEAILKHLNVTVSDPFKLIKFGDKLWQNEVEISGESIEKIVDASLKITSLINEVLGISVHVYNNSNEEHVNGDQHNGYRTKNHYNNGYRQSPSQHSASSSPYSHQHERGFHGRSRQGIYEQTLLIRNSCVPRIVGTRGSTIRRIQGKCHLRDFTVSRQANESGYVECKISAYQVRHLGFAVDTIRSYLRNEDDQAVKVFESHFVELPSQASPYQNSPHHDQPQLSSDNHVNDQNFQRTFPNYRYQQQQQKSLLSVPNDVRNGHRETGFLSHSLQFTNGVPAPPPSYNFQNPPSFDFTHRPTSASRKTDKRPGEVTDCPTMTTGHLRNSTEGSSQTNTCSSSSNSSSVSPRHKSKRACPESKDIDCTTDDGIWIQKQYYHALDENSREIFDSLLEKLEKIRIATEENAAKKQQRFVGRSRGTKGRSFATVTTSTLTTQTNQTNGISKVNEQNGHHHSVTNGHHSSKSDEDVENEPNGTVDHSKTNGTIKNH